MNTKGYILRETLSLSACNFPVNAIVRGAFNDMFKIDELFKEVSALPKKEREKVYEALMVYYKQNIKKIEYLLEESKKNVENKVTLDLNEITKKYKNNTSDNCMFCKNAIKSSILEAKLKFGSTCEIEFIERDSKVYELKPFDLFVNGYAERLLREWEI